jgi:hypothetical protein
MLSTAMQLRKSIPADFSNQSALTGCLVEGISHHRCAATSIANKSRGDRPMGRRAFILLSALSLCGCFAHGFDRSTVYTRLQLEPTQPEKCDEDVASAQALKPHITFPCRIAVYLPPGVNGSGGHWTAKDKEAAETWAKELKQDGTIADMLIMSDMFAPPNASGPSMKELRVAAAKHGANVLLALQVACEVDSYKNPAALFNWTIVGGYIVPASHRDARVTLQGALVDVANGFLYASVDSEGTGRIIRPTFLVEDKPAVDRAREKAMVAFGPEFLKRMRNVHATFGPGVDAAVRANSAQ